MFGFDKGGIKIFFISDASGLCNYSVNGCLFPILTLVDFRDF